MLNVRGFSLIYKQDLSNTIRELNTKVTQTDGAFFSRELRKFTAEEQMDQIIDHLSWYAVINNHTCRNFSIFDEVRICI